MIYQIALWIYYGAGMAAMLAIAFAICRRETKGGSMEATKKPRSQAKSAPTRRKSKLQAS